MNTAIQEEKEFLLEKYFLGETIGYGTIHNAFGALSNEFRIQMNGFWQSDTFILDEVFHFKPYGSKGKKQNRQWRIKKESDFTYIAESKDLITSAKGVRKKNTVNWKYNLMVPYGSKEIAFQFDDWIYASKSPTGYIVINKVKMKKFGLKLAELFITYSK